MKVKVYISDVYSCENCPCLERHTSWGTPFCSSSKLASARDITREEWDKDETPEWCPLPNKESENEKV